MSQITSQEQGVANTGPITPPPPPRATTPVTLSEQAYRARLDKLSAMPAMRSDNITLPKEEAARFASLKLIGGVAGLIVTALGALVVGGRHALAAYEVGVFTVTAMSLGALFFVMVFHSLNAGWTSTVRRQFENVASMLPFCWALLAVAVVIELVFGGVLMDWLKAEFADDYLLGKKTPYLNAGFFLVRFLIYGAVWSFLALRLRSLSVQQDASGDRALTRKARFMSGWGLPLFALTTAFFAYDFMMSLDFRFFSTMWGVYYFASAALSSVSAVILILAAMRIRGLLTGAVTEEHFHDLGKLVLSFTVFWSYIAFSQYFLIWYSNIPEETAWYVYRTETGGYKPLFIILAFGHFVVPFCIMLFRGVKRSTILLAAMAIYSILITVADIIWIVRPMVYVRDEAPGMATWWVDIAGVVGVFGVWGALLLRKVASGPLVPLKDPMLHEALKHKNYV